MAGVSADAAARDRRGLLRPAVVGGRPVLATDRRPRDRWATPSSSMRLRPTPILQTALAGGSPRSREARPGRAVGTSAPSSACGFGVGLSPYEIYLGFDERSAKSALARKLAWLDDIGVTDLAILFDDMRGDLPDPRRAPGRHPALDRRADGGEPPP